MLELVGIDPGLVSTGLVYIKLMPVKKEFVTMCHAIDGMDAETVAQRAGLYSPAKVFVEDYRPRNNLQQSLPMVKGMALLQEALPKAKFLPNWGVTSLVTKPMLELLDLWRSTIWTNHNDIRSAARIGLLAGLKDREFNSALATLVEDSLSSTPWKGSHDG